MNLKGCFLEVLEVKKLCDNRGLGDARLIRLNKLLCCMISQNILIVMYNVISPGGEYGMQCFPNSCNHGTSVFPYPVGDAQGNG